MKLFFFSMQTVVICSAVLLSSCTTSNRVSVPLYPSLDKISGIWVSADTMAMEPSLRNFRGQAVCNRDMTSISWLASAPYSGGYHTGILKINGEVPMASMFRWQPYQALRKTQWKGLELYSSTRMLPDEDGLLWRIEITNATNEIKQVDVAIDVIGFVSKYEGDWQWWYPFPKMDGMVTKRDEEVEVVRKNIGLKNYTDSLVIDELVEGKPTGRKSAVKFPTDNDIMNSPKYNSVGTRESVIINDHETPAVSGFIFKSKPDSLYTFNSGGTGIWKLTLKPGEKKTIEYAMGYGDDSKRLQTNLTNLATNFDQKFDGVKKIWEDRWHRMFEPGQILSASFPILTTADTVASRVYYTGPLTMLYLMNTNLPQHKRVILTGGPKWGATISFFWDNTEWSTVQATVDPEMLKENLRSWIKIDPSKFYGVDNFGGGGVGNAYSANYYALFQLIRSYISVTGDYDFLHEQVDGKTVLETLQLYATNWERISSYGKPGCTDPVYKLGDFGNDEWNLLECVPTYKNIVPSFNAGYIWMMRETTRLYDQTGDSSTAHLLESKAEVLKEQLLKLYAGSGVWNCLYPNNKQVQVRHCLDFMFVGRFLSNDLSASMKKEMVAFLYDELITDHWMRAQSLLDSAAKNSDRPDHGPLGAFDGWPAGTMDALVQMGYPQNALDFYHAIAPVTLEGSWAQAHELWGDNKGNKNAKVRIAERGWHARDAIAGIGMSQVMLKCFFGFNPSVDGKMIQEPGRINFKGTLHHVYYKGERYTITSDNGKVTYVNETE